MKKFNLMVLSTSVLFLSQSIWADDAHHDSTRSEMKQSQETMGMMNMGMMQGNMENMQKIMQEIHNTKDAKKRQKLVEKHMREMGKAMGMMNSNMMGPMNNNQDMDEMPDMKNIMWQQMMMRNHMSMMQHMMSQMMEQMKLQKDMGMGMEMN